MTAPNTHPTTTAITTPIIRLLSELSGRHAFVTGLELDTELSRAQSISWYHGPKICRSAAVGSLSGMEVDGACVAH